MKKWDKRLASKLRKKWWWLRSENKLKKFEDDPWGQAFELLRRLPGFKKEWFFTCFSNSAWKSLGKINKANFRLNYGSTCVSKGLYPAKIFGGDKGITFDCRVSGNSVLDALKLHLNDPAPLCSEAGPTFRSKSRLGTPDISRSDSGNQNKNLFVPMRDPYRVYVPIPKFLDESVVEKRPRKRSRSARRDEIITHVRKIIRHEKYKKYRARMIAEFGTIPPRRRFSPRSITFKLLTMDAEEEGLTICGLRALLDESFPTYRLFCVREAALQRSLYHAKSLVI